MGATNLLSPWMGALLTAVKNELTTPVGRSLVMPGNSLVEDDCCEGQLSVRLVSLVGSSNMARPALQPCVPLWQVRVAITVVRCAHTLNDQGVAPTPAQMTADAFTSYQDFFDMLQAVSCTFAAYEGVDTLRIEQWLPTAVSTCVGGELTISFQLNLCQPCQPVGD